MARILIIEDECDLAELVAFNLQQEGLKTAIALDGLSGLESALDDPPDLVILDLMLTARGEEFDRVVGFEVGADDYVVKPFSVRELVLRVKARLRRSGAEAAEATAIRLGPLTIDAARHEVTVAGEPVALTTTEYKLLLALVERKGRVQSRDVLLKNVWGYAYGGDTRTVDTHVTRLRTKLGVAGEMIHTVRGFGYKLEVGG